MGHDIVYEDNLVEAVLPFTAKINKAVLFLVRDAFVEQKGQGIPNKRMVTFLPDDAKPLLFHNEPIIRNGEAVGYLTSGNYAHYFGVAIGIGYVLADEPITSDFIANSEFSIRVAGAAVPAAADLKPFYDPTAQRMRF